MKLNSLDNISKRNSYLAIVLKSLANDLLGRNKRVFAYLVEGLDVESSFLLHLDCKHVDALDVHFRPVFGLVLQL